MRHGRPERIDDVDVQLLVAAERFGVDGAKTALVVPLIHRGQSLGVPAGVRSWRRARSRSATTTSRTLKAFAASAATAVATAQTVQHHRLRDALAAAEAERRRWAQELHDETLQALGGLRVLLSSARRAGKPELLDAATGQALEQIEQEITNLRAIITELRPAALDELGLAAALEALFQRHRTINDLEIIEALTVSADDDAGELASDIQATVYRVVQEALTNVVKHAQANTVRVNVRVEGQRLVAEVADDGRGFAVADGSDGGFGLTGMRERVLLAGGELTIDSGEGGTIVSASLPLDQPPASRGNAAASSPRLSA